MMRQPVALRKPARLSTACGVMRKSRCGIQLALRSPDGTCSFGSVVEESAWNQQNSLLLPPSRSTPFALSVRQCAMRLVLAAEKKSGSLSCASSKLSPVHVSGMRASIERSVRRNSEDVALRAKLFAGHPATVAAAAPGRTRNERRFICATTVTSEDRARQPRTLLQMCGSAAPAPTAL